MGPDFYGLGSLQSYYLQSESELLLLQQESFFCFSHHQFYVYILLYTWSLF